MTRKMFEDKQEISNTNMRFYKIDINYLRYLYKFDKQIYYSEKYENNNSKPYLGIIILQNHIKYFIPLSSPKLRNRFSTIYTLNEILIYEIIDNKNISDNMVVREYSKNKKIKIIGKIDIKKMIPVKDGCYEPIDFNKIDDYKYKSLLKKQFRFCLKNSNEISKNAIEKWEKIIVILRF